MDQQSPPPSSKRGKKACTECRQQKAKCDAYLDPDQPCSRCVKMKTRCLISDPFRREHKRQRLSELENETDELRRKLRSSSTAEPPAPQPQPSPIAMLTAAAEMGVHSGHNTGDLPPTPQSHMPAISYNPPQLLPSVSLGSSMPRIEFAPDQHASEPTESRSLNSIHVTGNEVDEIFQLFFQQYAPFLPILDPNATPNSYHAQSPFLFWAIIGVASRTYPKNPTLFTALAKGVIDMALLSVGSTLVPWHVIQGLLLILTWPFPKDMSRPDLTFPLSGLLLHVAMQHGLHIPMSSHEFYKVRGSAPSQADMIRRSELWARCVIVYQRSCFMKGQSPSSLVDFAQDLGQRQVLFQMIGPSLILEVKCQDIIARCSAAVQEIGVRTMSLDQERALHIILREFESQTSDLEAHTLSTDDHFQIIVCRLSILALHFFKNKTMLSTNCLPRLLTTSCVVIDSIRDMGDRLGGLANTPHSVFFGLLLAPVALLRILKVYPSRGLDLERARTSFFTAINQLKRMSVDNNDPAAKTVIILNQLWNSTRAFRKSDGSEYTALRIRSRLVLSPCVDAVWWWRDEYDPQGRPFVSSGPPAAEVESNRDAMGSVGNAPAHNPPEPEQQLLFDEQFLADFEWALCENAIFPPAEPYASTWPSTGSII